jgi:hypothetical protein
MDSHREHREHREKTAISWGGSFTSSVVPVLSCAKSLNLIKKKITLTELAECTEKELHNII